MVNQTELPPKIALVGESLIELSMQSQTALRYAYGGDTINMAVYLKRLVGKSADVFYVTALGTDPFSENFTQQWQVEGIDTRYVLRDPARLPGIYSIQVDERGERSFLYWRGESAARQLLQHPDFARSVNELSSVNWLILSGITCAITPPADRPRLLAHLRTLAAAGTRLVFDTNDRRRLWTVTDAREVISALMPSIDLMLVSFDDERALWGDPTVRDTCSRMHAAGVPRVIVKDGARGAWWSEGGPATQVPARSVVEVVDTTAAGDSFNAAFMAALIQGRSLHACCESGNTLAAEVIRHPGAIIPIELMPRMDGFIHTAP